MKNLLLILFYFSMTCLSAQTNKRSEKLFDKAKQATNAQNYIEAIKLLNEAIAIDSGYYDLYLLQSDVYLAIDSTALQIQSLENALRLHPDKQPKLHFSLGNAFFRLGLYQKAKEAYLSFLSVDTKSNFKDKSISNIQKCNDALTLIQHPVPFDVNQLGPAINSADDEYWPSLTVDGQILFFTRLIRRDDPAPNSNQFVHEDIFNSQLVENCWQESHPLSSLNSNENEGAQSISADGQLLFYTACNRPDGMRSCDIYYSILRSGKWSEPFNAGEPVSSVDWDAQPSFSVDGRTIYFSSNRKGGKGGMDIWKCDLLKFMANGTAIWGYPVNLGDSINTPGNEMSPFIHSDGKTLYFASNHWPGMGGSDIFYSRMLDQKTWSKARNLGYPINTFKDEMGLVVDASGANAYFSSDRLGSQGKDIYEFKLYAEARPFSVSYIKGKVIDDSTAEPLFAKIELTNLQQSKSIIQTQTDRTTGEFLIGLPLGSEYAFNISSEGYLFFSKNIIVSDMNQQIEPQLVEFRLNKIESGNSVTLNNVFFETGSAIINHQSFPELQKLLELLINNQEIKIEIEGHTDNIGNEVYNQKLSESRAESVYNYLVEHGIDKDRLKFIGYGLSKPVSSNDTPVGRALNRRTVFRILGKRG